MTEMTFKQAVGLALRHELASDDDVFLIGEDIGAPGGVFKTTEGLQAEFGADRVLDTPISEQAIVGAAIGAAVMGLRPVAEVMFADFVGVCHDQIANELAKYRYMTGGQVAVPVTIRMTNGSGNGFGAQHSQSVENWFLNVPGLKLVTPSTPADAYGLLRSAIRDPDPVLFFEHKGLLNLRGSVVENELVPLGEAAVVSAGDDVTVVTTQAMRHRTLEAVAGMANSGISVELIDLRCVAPLDLDAVAKSVAKTGRLVCVQESPIEGSWATLVVSAITTSSFELLDAPPRVAAADSTPVPYAAPLEEAWLPTNQEIVAAIRETAEF